MKTVFVGIALTTLAMNCPAQSVDAIAERNQQQALHNGQFADPGNEIAKSYAKDFGVSIGEATRRLRVQAKARKLRAELVSKYPDTFAGLIITNTGAFKVKAKFKSPVTKPLTTDPDLIGDIVSEPALHSLEELSTEFKQLVALTSNITPRTDVALDEENNAIILYTTNSSDLTQALQKSNYELPDFVKISQVESLLTPAAAVYGGRSHVASSGDHAVCTTGFVVIQPATGIKGISSAGHCDDPAYYNFSLSAGYSSAGSYSILTKARWDGIEANIDGDIDLRWGTVSGGSYTPMIYDGTAQLTITGTVVTNVGDYICKMGRTTNRTCGTMTQAVYHDSTYNGEYTCTNVYAQPGDSGGPVYTSGGKAAGWVHAIFPSTGYLCYMEAYIPETRQLGIKVLY